MRCVLIGGFAVNYHKVARQTVDVDFLITGDDFDKISGALGEAGYKQDFRTEVFVRLRSGSAARLMDIDFMFVDEDTLAKIIKEGRRAGIAGREFIVPSLEGLIALKLHSLKHNFKLRQTRDLPDIVELARANKIDVKGRKFRELCLKYGTEDIYRRLTEAI